MKKIVKEYALIIKILSGIIFGILLGAFCRFANLTIPVRLLATFNEIFSQYLNFVIPLLIIAFVTSGIAELGLGAGKILAVTTAIAYLSTILSGLFSFFSSRAIFPLFIKHQETILSTNPEDALLAPYLHISILPLMDIMSALVLSFLLGLGISITKSQTCKKISMEFQHIMVFVIEKTIIPLLPFHICGVFANMSYAGEVGRILSVFLPVFLCVIAFHWIIIVFQFSLACCYGKKNVLRCLKHQISPYLTAVGTQSSAATIPINLKAAEKNKVTKSIAEFVVPLCATIHLSGSTITLTACSIAILLMNDLPILLSTFFPFILMLGVSMVAAPGVPGGAVMAALGLFGPMLGFNEAQIALMIALYITQDSFGTACNVSGDNAIAIVIDKLFIKNDAKQQISS